VIQIKWILQREKCLILLIYKEGVPTIIILVFYFSLDGIYSVTTDTLAANFHIVN
jgi:hypothetical protein